MNEWSNRFARSAVAVLISLTAFLPLSAEAADRLVTQARSVLQTKLLRPLREKESHRSRFSRAVLPPSARRIRILDDTVQKDLNGRQFLEFAVDETHASEVENDTRVAEADWYKDAIVGCVYPETGAVVVKLSDVYYDSAVLLGKPASTSPAGVCRSR